MSVPYSAFQLNLVSHIQVQRGQFDCLCSLFRQLMTSIHIDCVFYLSLGFISLAAGSMLHLIVEACIARKLIDTSAYFWPDYVVPQAPSNDSIITHESPWPTFMGGAPLTGSLKNALIMTPASRYKEF